MATVIALLQAVILAQANIVHSSSLTTMLPIEPRCPTNCSCDVTYNPITACSINCSSRVCEEESLFDELDRYLADNNLRNIVNLAINSAQLISVPPAVCKLRQLRTLDLNDNCIKELNIDCINQLQDLTEFTATHNNISRLTSSLFANLSNMRYLDLQYNSIETIEDGVFSDNSTLPMLQSIDLSNNRLSTLDTWPLIRAKVQPGIVVNLTQNLISNFTDNLHMNSHLCEVRDVNMHLSLTYNLIDHVTDLFYGWGFNTTIDVLCLYGRKGKSFFILDLRGYYECDCTDYKILVYHRMVHATNFDTIFCRDWPGRAPALKLTLIYPEQLTCLLAVTDGSGCTGTRRPWNSTCHVQCSKTGLTSLPHSLPECPKSYRYKLDFSGNNITVLENRSYFDSTVYLDITDNPVQRIDPAAVHAIENIKEVYLPKTHKRIWPNVVDKSPDMLRMNVDVL